MMKYVFLFFRYKSRYAEGKPFLLFLGLAHSNDIEHSIYCRICIFLVVLILRMETKSQMLFSISNKITGMKAIEIQLTISGISNKEKMADPYIFVLYNTVQSITSAIGYLKIPL